jgi:hypothetical protein
MKYLCLGYYDPSVFDTMSPADQEAIAAECRPHDEALHRSGRLVSVASLEHRKAVSLRPNRKGGGPSVTDGPYTEAKEVVGSFFIVEADDLEEAVRIASLHPAANWGADLAFGVEVRPIEYYVETARP